MLESQRVEFIDSIDSIYDKAYELGWTDGLPIIPPTEGRVQAFVNYLKRDPAEVIAEIPPSFGVATIEKVVINAIMAGCRPEYLRVLLAAIEAVMEPQYNLNAIQATTGPAAPLLIINGPIRNQIGVNCGSNALGQGCRANATIGRALRLILVNIGGGVPGSTDKATLGQPGKYTFCLGENEEESPWEPLHVERGFSPEQSTVTVLAPNGNYNITVLGQDAESMLTVIANSMTVMGAAGNSGLSTAHPKPGSPLLVLCPSHANILAKAGLSRLDVKRILWERARIPLDMFPRHVAASICSQGREIDGKAVLTLRPEVIMIVVAGGPAGLHTAFLPPWGDTYAITKSILA